MNIFETAALIPDILDPFVPTMELKVSYGGYYLNNGQEIELDVVKEDPRIEYDGDPDSYYMLIMVDPDAPSRQKPAYRSWKHWLVTNIPGNRMIAADHLTGYVAPSPHRETGFHRYTLILYKQPKRIPLVEFVEYERLVNASFNVRGFAIKHKLGNPVASFFFQCKKDPPKTS